MLVVLAPLLSGLLGVGSGATIAPQNVVVDPASAELRYDGTGTLLSAGAPSRLVLADYDSRTRHVQLGDARFTVLGPRSIRMEYRGGCGGTVDCFDDQPSTTFINRAPPIPVFASSVVGNVLEINTSALRLRYTGGAFTAKSLSVVIDGVTQPWRPGMTEAGNLNGSLVSTDCSWCESLTECSEHANTPSGCISQYQRKMQPGLLNREGWHLIDDSGSFLFDGNNESWPPHGWRVKRNTTGGYTDWTLLGYGQNNFRQALSSYASLGGSIPLMPHRAYGVWWSRYFPYNVTGITAVVEGYAAHQLPLNYVVLDIDWHAEPPASEGCNIQRNGTLKTSLCLNGYGGYSWNRQLFPDPERFQEWLHSKNLSLMLNVHDLCGEDHCQRAYPAVAKAVGIDPASNETVICAFENEALQEALHTHELESGENAAVDAWWTDSGETRVGDWSNGTAGSGGSPTGPQVGWQCIADTPQTGDGTRHSNTPATLWQSYVRTSRHIRKGKRGFRLGVYGGLGSHRYPLVGSGDTHSAWETIAYEVYMTITGANVLTAWRHDVGGFFQGSDNRMVNSSGSMMTQRDPELFLRWLQFAVFSPVVTPHCNHCELRPWLYPNFDLLQAYFQLRNSLVPYIYSAAFSASRTGVLPLHALYIDYPDEEAAYEFSRWNSNVSHAAPCPHVPQFAPCATTASLEYAFGASMVVAPIFEPAPYTTQQPQRIEDKDDDAATCRLGAPQHGVVATGGGPDPSSGPDHLFTANASDCRAVCCARNGSCGGYTWDPQQPRTSGGTVCPPGHPCCWLKHPGAKAVPGSSRFVSGVVDATPSPAPPPPPADPNRLVSKVIWVPPGRWMRWQTAETFEGPIVLTQNFSSAEMPVFVKAGAVIPLKDLHGVHEVAPRLLKLQVIRAGVAGVTTLQGTTTVYEDVSMLWLYLPFLLLA